MNEIKGSVQHSLEVTKCDRYFRKALEYSIQNVKIKTTKMKMHVERSHEESDMILLISLWDAMPYFKPSLYLKGQVDLLGHG